MRYWQQCGAEPGKQRGKIGVSPNQSARKRCHGEGKLNCYRIVTAERRKRMIRRHQKVRSQVSVALCMLKRMDIALPVYRQLLKRHNYSDYGTWKPQYAPENGWEPREWNYMRSGNRIPQEAKAEL